MLIIFSNNNVPLRLTSERWEHIINRHPEMSTEKGKIQETLENPDLVQKGDYGTLLAVKFYAKTPLTSKYLIVVYKETNKLDGFILTSYFTIEPNKNRTIIWKH